nr:hypothetical protein [Tanacetum cinerariifolium]
VEAGPLRVPRHQMVPSIQGIPVREHKVSQWAKVGAQGRARSLEMGGAQALVHNLGKVGLLAE